MGLEVDLDAITWDGDFVLDREYRLLSVAHLPEITSQEESLTGTSIWDVFGGESHMRPAAELVFETGETGRMRGFWDGVVSDIAAEPHGRFLRVRYRIVRRVDTTTLDKLLDSVRGVAADLARPFGSPAAS